MDLKLKDKVALVTGASRGIGEGIALSLADEGCDLMLTGRDETALAGVASAVAKRGRKVAISILDLRTPGAEKPLVEAVRREFGRLDVLVNNAGATQRGDFFKLTDADWADGFALKFFAHVRLTREAWPLLKAQKGAMVTIAGIGGKEPEAPFTIGSSVNAACVAFSKAMADIGKSDGVQVNSINPGRVETDRLWRRFRSTMESTGKDEAAVREEYRQEFNISRFGKVEDLGSFIAFLVSPHGRWVHGATIDIDGGEVKSV
ncbi:SDR family oxidoreductase [Rhodoplanes sp. Z2-YC6860]|uniref:SDR family oxidoreductase n=1 Tax=Rhodoplanes sp. Z2-YC6860 TaxID=674703 RepID=UPI00078D3581|nr:SDR family oxidoreductase [Rhodoplanes sp. Z2-YC6860]AMN40149.1 short-chain dehydrogenase/reductase SDR [Rhodoplanes sp. Z2-YC6860]